MLFKKFNKNAKLEDFLLNLDKEYLKILIISMTLIDNPRNSH